ncbi:MAG: PEGA domain-containing protein [Myxococcales bacterium]
MIRAQALGLIAALLALPSGAAQAQAKTKLAVVRLWSPPNLAGIAAKLTLDLEAVAATESYAVLPSAQVEQLLGAQSFAALQACNGKSACIAAHAGGLPADRMVVGTLDRNESSYLVRLYLVDLSGPTVISSVDRSILIASRRLHQDVHAALPRLLRGEEEAKGKVIITTSARGATVYLDAAAVGTTPCTVEGKPGKHALKVVKDGYLPVERFVTIEVDGAEEISLLLTPVAGRAPAEQAPVAANLKAEPEGAGGIAIPAGAWAAGGVALAAAGVGGFFGARVSEVEGRAGTRAPYQITRAEALGAERDALIANLCFGAAGAAAVTAVLLTIFTSGDESEDKPAPVPTVPTVILSSSGASLAVGGSF